MFGFESCVEVSSDAPLVPNGFQPCIGSGFWQHNQVDGLFFLVLLKFIECHSRRGDVDLHRENRLTSVYEAEGRVASCLLYSGSSGHNASL